MQEKEMDAMSTFILFRSHAEAEFCCAVPEGYSMPRFLKEGGWEPFGKIGEGAETWPCPFHAVSADACARINGYYLFQAS